MEYVIFGALMFAGGFVDAVAGGGGLLTIPAYFSLNIPIANVVGTNKLSSSMSTTGSFLQYLKSNKVKLKLILKLAPFSFVGSVCGVFLFYMVEPDILEKLVPIVIISVGIYSIIDKNLGLVDGYSEPNFKKLIVGAIPVFFIGMYDGFLGPGTGIFFTLTLVKLYKMDFVSASGGTKLLNVVSGVSALVVYYIKGGVLIKIGLVGFAFALAGSLIGSKIAIKKGAKFIKPVFILISFIMAIRILLKN